MFLLDAYIVLTYWRMESVKISKKVIDDLPPTGKTYFCWDTQISGYGVRVTANGSKAFVYQYRLGGRGSPEKRTTIGKCKILTPDAARKIALDYAEKVRGGIDPVEEKKVSLNAKAQRKKADIELAFKTYYKSYLEKRVKVDVPKSYPFMESILRLHAAPTLADKPVDKITRKDLIAVIETIPSNQPAVRRQVYLILSKLFKWAVGRDDIAASPMIGMNAPIAANARDRVLTDNELVLVLGGARMLGMVFGSFFNLLAITGQRRSEVAGLDWSELNRDECLWTLPEERCKNGVKHLVPLSTMAIEILDHLAAVTDQKKPVWPSKGLVFTTTGRTPISGFSRAKQHLDTAMLKIAKDQAAEAGENPETIEIADWRIHDLRRTMATGFQKLGVRFEVTEATLNHISGMSRAGVAGVYQQHDWKEEKREALEKWAQHCERLLAG